jgi:hypothetical protein
MEGSPGASLFDFFMGSDEWKQHKSFGYWRLGERAGAEKGSEGSEGNFWQLAVGSGQWAVVI